ncbi:MAG: hexitol phosphatase HxpB [Myxococcota bacterium]
MIPAVFFDMDGVLVDSEPEWQQAEIAIFSELGVTLTVKDCVETKGMRIDEVVRYWFSRFPWQGPSLDETTERIVAEMERRLRSVAQPMKGAVESLRSARKQSDTVAIVSSSPHRLIDAVVERLGIAALLDFCVSGEDVAAGKPHPEIYLLAASKAKVAPVEAWVIEDSVFGVVAAKAARMRCIAVPAAEERDDPRFSLADECIDSLLELNDRDWGTRT